MTEESFKTYSGFQNPVYSEFDRTVMAFNALLGNIQTALPCQVLSSEQSGVNITGHVNIKIMVNQTDGAGNSVDNAIINGVPYLRIQGGVHAVICDPRPGDFGLAVFASRDISKFTQSRTQSNPASFRQFSLSDAVFLCGIRNQTPTQYIHFTDDSIEIISPNKVHINAPEVVVDSSNCTVNASNCTINAETTNNGNVTINGNLMINGTIGQGAGGGGGGNVSLIGPMNVINDVHAEGISVAHHTHTCPDGGTSEPH